jgi:hypothetical protein
MPYRCTQYSSCGNACGVGFFERRQGGLQISGSGGVHNIIEGER